MGSYPGTQYGTQSVRPRVILQQCSFAGSQGLTGPSSAHLARTYDVLQATISRLSVDGD